MKGSEASDALEGLAKLVRNRAECSVDELLALLAMGIGATPRATLTPHARRRGSAADGRRCPLRMPAVPAGSRCSYCRRALKTGDHLSPEAGEWDHVVPLVQGGSHSWNNVVPSCKSCNSRKGGRTPEQAGMVLQ
jgi:5-methylcytosine-specific restriction endonuclease McrA